VKIFVQAKRQKLGSKVAANVVRPLGASIPSNVQIAFITMPIFGKALSLLRGRIDKGSYNR
jgi:hypothetical protein